MRATVTIISNSRCSVSFRHPDLDQEAKKKARTRIVNLLDDALAIEQKGSHFIPGVQQGLWDGRRHLFYKDGCTFPKGIMQRLKKLLREAGYKVMKTKDLRKKVHGEVDLDLVSETMLADVKLRPDQLRVITAALEEGCGLLHVATGGGKTADAAAIIKVLIEKRCLFLVHTKQLLRQARSEIARFLGTIEEYIGVIGDGKFDPKHITIATVQSLSRVSGQEQKKIISKYLKSIDLLILDECFPAGTMIGDKPIELIRVGDVVLSFDGEKLVQKKVVRLFVSKPRCMVRITIDGREVICTSGHPFLTSCGWLPAIALTCKDVVLCTTHGVESFMRSVPNQAAWSSSSNQADLHVQEVQGGATRRTTHSREDQVPLVWEEADHHLRRWQGNLQSGTQGSSLLLGSTQEVAPVPGISEHDGCHQSEVCLSSDDIQQSDEPPLGSEESKRKSASDGVATPGDRWQRKTDASSATVTGVSAQVAYGGGGLDQGSPSQHAGLLQGRHRFDGTQDSDRSRWHEPLLSEGSRTGSEEGQVLAWTRVEGVEVFEPTGDGTFGGVCPDGLVYNLEVEDTHTYVAEGFVVHNCHHSSAKSFYRLVQRIDAPWRFGMSGTPFGLADGKGLMVEAAFGPVVVKVTNKELGDLGVNARPTIRMVEVDKPMIADGVDWQSAYKEGIVHNIYRNDIIAHRAQDFAKKDFPTLILVRELQHGDNISELLRARKVKHAFVHGQMSTDEVERQKARLTEGQIHVLIASPIFGEGVDIPSVRALIVADGGQSVANVLQKIGRGLRRKADDNRLDVIDFADMTHRWLARHSQERLALYQGEGFEVISGRVINSCE